MEVNSTEASSSSQGGTSCLDLTLVTFTETVTFTEVVAEEEWGSFYYSFKTEQLVTLWILFIVTISGNAIVLFSTWRRKRKSRMTYFVTQLAITDSFTGLINIMTDIIWRYTGDFMAPDIVCRVVRYFQVVLLYASTYVLVSLSIDRYHAIVYPMKFLQGERQAKVLIGVAWGLSFLFSIPTLIIFGKRQLSNGEVQCWALWPDDSYWIPYMTVVAFLVYFIPLIIISVIYSIVIRTIWMKSKAQAVIISSCPGGKTSRGYTSRGFISRAKVKAIKYSIVIILGKEELKGWGELSGKGAMEGSRCKSCQNQNTSSTDNVLQSHTGTCTEENRGPPQALCMVKWMDIDWQEPAPCAPVHLAANVFWVGDAASPNAHCQCQAQYERFACLCCEVSS
ncbi:neuropeptide S receptor isoform X1 [Agelaius tricolor]|uniref:neuropeptide S receptor isoform X1 n=1 Tax=Agelaius tricolor TaxID=9191 RepID=UPI0039F25EA2